MLATAGLIQINFARWRLQVEVLDDGQEPETSGDEPGDGISEPWWTDLITLRDARPDGTKLPKAEADAPKWRAAIKALMLVAEHGRTFCPRGIAHQISVRAACYLRSHF